MGLRVVAQEVVRDAHAHHHDSGGFLCVDLCVCALQTSEAPVDSRTFLVKFGKEKFEVGVWCGVACMLDCW
jgi:hypothetical protein